MKAPPRARPPRAPRVRRTAADARDHILETAERELREHGPAGLRLQDVAKAAGISHPTVLHHFGSREGLVGAVIERAALALQRDLAATLADANPDPSALFERVAESFATRGHARLIAWLLLSGYQPMASPAMRDGWQAITRRTHALRGKRASAVSEDTQFTVLLAWLALFGQAIAGPALAEVAGLSPAAERRFRTWLATLLATHLAQ